MQGIYGIYSKKYKEWWYVGQSNNMQRRLIQHKSPRYDDEWHTYFRKHQDEFEFIELEWVALRQNLLTREEHYIKKLNPKYTTVEANKGSIVGPSWNSGKTGVYSQETLDKISAKMTGENNPAKRPEVRDKMRAAKKGKKRPKFTWMHDDKHNYRIPKGQEKQKEKEGLVRGFIKHV